MANTSWQALTSILLPNICFMDLHPTGLHPSSVDYTAQLKRPTGMHQWIVFLHQQGIVQELITAHCWRSLWLLDAERFIYYMNSPLCLLSKCTFPSVLIKNRPFVSHTKLSVNMLQCYHHHSCAKECPASVTTISLYSPIFVQWFERLIMRHIKTMLALSLDPLVFHFHPNSSILPLPPPYIWLHLYNKYIYIYILLLFKNLWTLLELSTFLP